MSEQELAALVDEYASGARSDISARFLAVLRENAVAAAVPGGDPAPAAGSSEAGGTGSTEGEGAATLSLVPLYQRLFAVAVLQALSRCLEAPEAAAAAQLAGLLAPHGHGADCAAQGRSQVEEALAAAEAAGGAEAGDMCALEQRHSQQVSGGVAAEAASKDEGAQCAVQGIVMPAELCWCHCRAV